MYIKFNFLYFKTSSGVLITGMVKKKIINAYSIFIDNFFFLKE